MDSEDLIIKFIENYNNYYSEKLIDREEPRYRKKQFFIYTYRLFKSLDSTKWTCYIEGYKKLFLRPPTRDFYGIRSPNIKNELNNNSLEWIATFEIIAKIGYPKLQSAKDKMLHYLYKQYIPEALASPNDNFQDFMLCSFIQYLPDESERYQDKILKKIKKISDTNNDLTPHQLIAYLLLFKKLNEKGYIDIIRGKLKDWILSPAGTPEKQLLIWARLISELNDDILINENIELIQFNFKFNLKESTNIEWFYIPYILNTLCIIKENVNLIQTGIESKIIQSEIHQMLSIFRFINEKQKEVNPDCLKLKEKCKSNPSADECSRCISSKIGDCWIRVIASVLNVTPKVHSPFEVADVVIYTYEQGIYFVIKAKEIKGSPESDILYHQISKLFNTDHALILYWNPHDTAPIIISQILDEVNRSNTNPRFYNVPRNIISQVYDYYIKDKPN